MKQFLLSRFLIWTCCWANFSCTYLLGVKSKEITFFLENDSVELVSQKSELIKTSPFTRRVYMKEPKITFKVLGGDSDTFSISYKRKIKDLLYLESFMYIPISLGYGYYMLFNEKHGYAFNYPSRLYIDILDVKKPISPWPRLRSGWTRLNLGFTMFNYVDMQGAELNEAVVGPTGIGFGGEYFVDDKHALTAEAGIFLGGDTRSSADDITDTSRVYRLNVRQANVLFSRQLSRRFSLAFGASLHQTRFRLEKRDTSTLTKTFVTLSNIERNAISPIIRANYWLRPNSTLSLSYSPVFGKNPGHIFQFGLTVNFHLFQPSRYRIRFDDRFGGL
jgi:hypothetical protein